MDLLLGFESLDTSDLPLPIYTPTPQAVFNAASLDFHHQSCSDLAMGVRPIANGGQIQTTDAELWVNAASGISQTSWHDRDSLLYPFTFEDILLSHGLQQSPGPTPSTMFNTSSDITDSPASGDGKHDSSSGSVSSNPVDGDQPCHWGPYVAASLSSPMQSLDFFNHNSTSTQVLPISTLAGPMELTASDELRGVQSDSIAMDASFVSLRSIEARDGPGTLSPSTIPMCVNGSMLDFELPAFSIPTFESTPTSAPYPVSSSSAVVNTTDIPRVPLKSVSLQGWSNNESSESSISISTNPKPTTLTFHSASKTMTRKQRKPLLPPYVYIPIKPPTRSTSQTLGPSPKTASSKALEGAPSPSPTVLLPRVPPTAPEAPHNSNVREVEAQHPTLRASESDDYFPSPSPSLSNIRSSSPASVFRTSPPAPARKPLKSTTKRKARRGRGKAKGSAALALAVVTQLGTSARDADDVDPVALYQEGKLNLLGIRKRKNNPIPLPIPVPNLNKKSRGRKVPYVAPGGEDENSTKTNSNLNELSPASAAPFEMGHEDFRSETQRAVSVDASVAVSEDGNSYGVSTRGRRRSSVSSTAPQVLDPLADKRTYVCDVAGCGKCFVRGEHLKRHIRSIHTYEKRE
ncbi:hypothetical protein CVT24_012111 [Panaeolus cyanescens]|uniref:C2H2-type domain-containing protein n=1 Tax=Panaeolus cyanescens TaxID=181874 RepID=A0A409VHD0_9AGAR|nr:hypothetical protein CVT24_012111 [Panaeolus cyanescens]